MKKNLFFLLCCLPSFLFSHNYEHKDSSIQRIDQNKVYSQNDNPKLYSFYKEEISKFVFVNYFLFQVQDGKLRGIVSNSAQMNSEYFIEGDYKDGIFTGKIFQIGCSEDCSANEQKFNIQLNDQQLVVPEELKSYFDDVPVYNGMNFITSSRKTELRSQPTLDSEQFYHFEDEVEAEILEIGSYEKIDDMYDVWYKVKIHNEVGWVFGGLCSLCISGS